MKRKKYLVTYFFIVLMLMLTTACSKKGNNTAKSKDAQEVYGSWAYIHDKNTVVAEFNKDGTAKYDGKDYSFDYDSKFIRLKSSDGETLQLRYTLDDDGMYLYKKTTYTYDGEGNADSLVGEWTCKEENWTFSFTQKGTFKEDGYFPGHYTVDNKNSTFKLIYNDQFEDTVCYFNLEDNKLDIEYPWRMVRASNK